METLASLRRKHDGAKDIKSVVRTMKALAASNIGHYEQAVLSLNEYYHTVSLGIVAYFRQGEIETPTTKKQNKGICAIVFGSDQGLVGQFNDSITDVVAQSLQALTGVKEIWAVGERVQLLLLDAGFKTTHVFPLPNSVKAITPLVQQLLIKCEEAEGKEIHIFHNKPLSPVGYTGIGQRLLPLDDAWKLSYTNILWPTKTVPQVIGATKDALLALINEYLFVSLFKASAESLASENASRLAAMQRAEKNIEELLDNLDREFNSLRQSTIDEELFDVVSGFEALKDDKEKS